MSLCARAHTHTHTHAHTHRCMHSHTHTHVHTHAYTRSHMHTHDPVMLSPPVKYTSHCPEEEQRAGLSPQIVHLWPSGFGGLVMFTFQGSLLDSFPLSLGFKLHSWPQLPVLWPWGGGEGLACRRAAPGPFLRQERGRGEPVLRPGKTGAWLWGVTRGRPGHLSLNQGNWSSHQVLGDLLEMIKSQQPRADPGINPHGTFRDCPRGWHGCVWGGTMLGMTWLKSGKSGNWLKNYLNLLLFCKFWVQMPFHGVE